MKVGPARLGWARQAVAAGLLLDLPVIVQTRESSERRAVRRLTGTADERVCWTGGQLLDQARPTV